MPEAIEHLNGTNNGDCTFGPGPRKIIFSVAGEIFLNVSLDIIDTEIDGGSVITIQRGNGYWINVYGISKFSNIKFYGYGDRGTNCIVNSDAELHLNNVLASTFHFDNYGILIIEDSILEKGFMTGWGGSGENGGAITNLGFLSVTRSTFNDNRLDPQYEFGGGSGAAIYSSDYSNPDVELHIKDSIFENNETRASEHRRGNANSSCPAISSRGRITTIENSTFNNNRDFNDEQLSTYGTTLCLSGSGIIKNIIVKNNIGDGVSISGSWTIDGLSSISNAGDGLRLGTSSIEVTNSTINDNWLGINSLGLCSSRIELPNDPCKQGWWNHPRKHFPTLENWQQRHLGKFNQ